MTSSSPRTPSRRTVLTGSAALAAAGFVPSPTAALAGDGRGGGHGHGRDRVRLTVLGTTDLHGNVLNWDYFKNAEHDNAAGDDVGVAKVATLIEAVRAERRGEPIITIDAGDTLQGTPLAYYYARVAPVTEGGVHPMAAAMNLCGYDAAALGNHEFNYGLDVLRTFEEQVDFPLLGANAHDAATGRPVFAPYVVRTFRVGGHGHGGRGHHGGRGRTLKVGILGLTNPGIAIWDRAVVEGVLEFPGIVEQAKVWVPRMKAEGCDVVVVAAHSGADTGSSYGDALPWPENASGVLAEEVPGVDAVLVGHAHQEIPQRFVRNRVTGRDVLLTEPLYWGMRLSVMDLDLRRERGRWTVVGAAAQTLNANTVDEHPAVAAAVADQHAVVVSYVNSVIGTSVAELPAARGVVEDVAVIDFVQHVQAGAVKAGLTGADADLPVLSIAAPFNRSAVFPAGDLTVRDVASLYVFDNTLLAVRVTGAQLKDYLEFSARYFKAVSGAGPHAIADVVNAPTPEAPNGTPDYNFDSVAGLDAPLTYAIDLAQPVGSRITGLAYDGTPVAAETAFVLAVNNYRQSGGGGFPHVSSAPVVVNGQQEIRQLLIDWVTENGTVDPADFASVDWRLVAGGEPLVVT
ncbi:MAG TPA: 5'-nucleotidase C-terminal domain-containing protein [Nocardioides sp.]